MGTTQQGECNEHRKTAKRTLQYRVETRFHTKATTLYVKLTANIAVRN